MNERQLIRLRDLRELNSIRPCGDGMPLSHKDGTMDRHVELKAEADRLMERAEKLDPIITDITKGA